MCEFCRPETPGERAHVMFLSMGLRHLPVVDEASHVVGIITRKDLDYAAGFGPWRRNKQASQVTISRALKFIPMLNCAASVPLPTSCKQDKTD